MGFSRQEYWSGLPCPPPGDRPDPGMEPRSLMFPALASRFFTTSATCEAQVSLLFGLSVQSIQLLSHFWLFAIPWTTARQASLSIANSQSLLKLMSIESVMPSNHFILHHPLLLPSVFPSIRVFSNELTLHVRWPNYWSFSFSIRPSNENLGLISFRFDWLDLLWLVGLSSEFSPTPHFKSTSSSALVLFMI